MYFSSNLSYLRMKRQLTQTALGNEIDLSKQIICLYETGLRDPSVATLIKVAHYFKITIDDLIMKDLRPTGSILSGNLKFLRKKGKFRQEDMARLLGYQDKSSYCLIENGNTKLSVECLVNVSEFFGVSVDDLLKKDLSKGGV